MNNRKKLKSNLLYMGLTQLKSYICEGEAVLHMCIIVDVMSAMLLDTLR